MPFASILIVRQSIAANPEGKKAAIAAATFKAISEATSLPPSDVWLVFDEVEARDWYLGSDCVHDLRFAQ